MYPRTSIDEPINMTDVYFLNRRDHIPIARMPIVKSPKKTAKAPLTGMEGRYPQYDSTIGQVWTVHAERQAFRSDELPLRHRICWPKDEFSMVSCQWIEVAMLKVCKLIYDRMDGG